MGVGSLGCLLQEFQKQPPRGPLVE